MAILKKPLKLINKKTTSKKITKKVIKKVAGKSVSKKTSVKKVAKKVTKKIIGKVVKKSPALPINYAQPVWTLDIPFEWRMSVSTMGVKWDRHLKQSIFIGEKLPDHLQVFKSHPFSLSWHKQFEANGRHLEELTLLLPKYTPRSHQDVAINSLHLAYKSNSPGFLIADEVGVGKTMSAWGFTLQVPEFRDILIVTTSSAQAHWRNTILHAGYLKTQNIMIINYDKLGSLFEEPEDGLSSTRKKGKRKRIAKQGSAPKFDLVIFDESHKGKNIDSARGLMMRKIEKKASFCIWASATAGQNPIELIYLASILSFASGSKVPAKTMDDFFTWCVEQNLGLSRGDYGRIVWDHQISDLDKMNSWMFKGKTPVGIRRLPEDIKDWPAIQRQLFLNELGFEQRKAYAKMWSDFVDQEMSIAKDSNVSKQKTALEKENNKQRLRQESSWLRIDSTIELVKDLLEQNRKVAISVGFIATLDNMVEKFQKLGISVCFINGSLSPNEKERQRLLFQDGNSNVCIFTVEEAISLHQGEYLGDTKPRSLVVHDIRWSAIQMAQIEGRCHRDGKLAPVFWMVAEDTVDIPIAQVMINKVKGMKALHGDPLTDMEEIESAISRFINNNKRK